MKQKILLVYTGGTIGMVKDKVKNTMDYRNDICV